MTTVLFIGRFQPMHKGHEKVIKELLDKYEKVIILIGSINKKDDKNPFKYEDRKKMIRKVLEDYKNFEIFGIEDNPSNEEWTDYIKNNFKFDIVVSGNDLVKELLRKFIVNEPNWYKRDIMQSTIIRNLVNDKKEWKHLVPKQIIIDIEGLYEKSKNDKRK